MGYFSYASRYRKNVLPGGENTLDLYYIVKIIMQQNVILEWLEPTSLT